MFPPGNQGHWSGGGDTETGIGERMGMCEWQLSAEACEKNLWTYVTLWTNIVFLFFT